LKQSKPILYYFSQRKGEGKRGGGKGGKKGGRQRRQIDYPRCYPLDAITTSVLSNRGGGKRGMKKGKEVDEIRLKTENVEPRARLPRSQEY